MPKSRYSTINHYLSDHEFVSAGLSDAEPFKYSQDHFDFIKDQCPEISDRLAVHVASLFCRDPVPMYEGELIEEQLDDNKMTMHFENIQSTNWNSLRFKPPPNQKSNVGWRVEFRTLDIQLTDFENTCLIVMMGLLVNTINYFNVDFLMPITKADENMKRAHMRNAILDQKFWFNRNFLQSEKYWESDLMKSNFLWSKTNESERKEPVYEEFTLLEILAGKDDFVGLFPVL